MTSFRRTASLAAVLASISAGVLLPASAAWQTSPPPKFGAWGLDLTARAANVKPGDGFFAYTTGNWLARTEIPPDQASASTGRDIVNVTQEQFRQLIEASAANSTTPTAAQIGGLYKSFMDEAAIDALDAKPLTSDLAAVQAVGSKADFVKLMGNTASNFGSA